jgi:hypothetical protein
LLLLGKRYHSAVKLQHRRDGDLAPPAGQGRHGMRTDRRRKQRATARGSCDEGGMVGDDGFEPPTSSM